MLQSNRLGESSNRPREPELSSELRFEVASACCNRTQQLLDPGKGSSRRSSSCFDRFVGAIEIVPCQRAHIGPQDQIRLALPNFKLIFLGRAYRAAYHLKDVRRSASVAVMQPHR